MLTLFCMLLADLILRYQTPLFVRVALLTALLLLAIFYGINRSWFTSLKLLVLLPFQRFSWQSEKYSSDFIFRISSLILSAVVFSIAIYSYKLGPQKNFENYTTSYTSIFLITILLFVLKYLANKMYFVLHQSRDLGAQLVDFHYSINQWFALGVGFILLIDVFYKNLDSNYFYVVIILSCFYFLTRLFGTILLLQNNFKYSIFTVFVYLCTFEIVPALVTVKVLFVNSYGG